MSKYVKYAKNIYTQNGEDGILEKLLQDLKIDNGLCVEFGAWDGIYISNIYNLWRYKGYKAILIEGDKDKFNDLKKLSTKFKNVETINCMIDYEEKSENLLENILEKSNTFSNDDFSILSIDVDSSDYYIFKSLNKYFPKILLCETNYRITSNKEYISHNDGCSLLSLNKLALEKGYKLVCFNLNGIFVREDLWKKLNIPELSVEEAYCGVNGVENYFQKLDNNGNIINETYYLSKNYKTLIDNEIQKINLL